MRLTAADLVPSICAMGLMASVTHAAPVAAQVPWSSAEEARSDFILLGHPNRGYEIWDLDRDAPVEGITTASGYLLADRPTWYVYFQAHEDEADGRLPGDFGIAHRYSSLRRVGAKPRPISVRMATCELCAETDVELTANRGFGPYLSIDHARIIYFKDGDLWSSDVDWGEGAVRNARQVTRVGLLNGVEVIHWHGDYVFLQGNFSEEKPIVRVDLGTGSIEELARMDVFGPSMFANPTGRYLCASMTEILACYDVVEDRSFRISMLEALNAVSEFAARRRHAPLFDASRQPVRANTSPIRWLDDNRAVGWNPVLVGLLDLEAESVRPVFAPEGPQPGGGSLPMQVMTVDLLPGGEFVEVVQMSSQSNEQIRVSLRDGSVDELPELQRQIHPSAWLDERHLIYGKPQGGLSEIGTWLYDAETGDERRICSIPLGGGEPVYSPERNKVYFPSHAQGRGIFRASLEDDSCAKISDEHDVTAWRVAPPGSVPASVLDSFSN